MNISCQITRKSDLPEAMARIEKEAGTFPTACFLICEEVLGHLMRNGDREIRISVRGNRRRHIEIRVEGEA